MILYYLILFYYRILYLFFVLFTPLFVTYMHEYIQDRLSVGKCNINKSVIYVKPFVAALAGYIFNQEHLLIALPH